MTRRRKPSDEADEAGTVEQHRPGPPAELDFRLEVVAGPDRGKSFSVDPEGGTVLLGQAALCPLRVTDPSVSRRHLELWIEDGLLCLRDLDSRNGTLVNGVVVVAARLRGGEQLRIGDTVLRAERGEPRARAARLTRLGRMIGGSDAMQPIFREISAALLDLSHVLIEGEPGTGKALLAQTLHERSPRAQGPFVVVPGEDLVLGDGAEPGSGVLAEASSGTLVIEEISGLAPAVQASLKERLHALARSGTASALSGHHDLRVVSTSSVDLEPLVKDGRLDADLLDLLAQRRVALPPLRERRGDVELLAAHFWQVFGAPQPLSPLALARLAERPWPGNVTELSREVARLVARALDEASGTRHSLDDPRDFVLPYSRARQRVLDRFERMYVERKLAACGGNVSRAAEEAGIARRYFQIVKSRHHL